MRELKCFVLTRKPGEWGSLIQYVQDIPSLALAHQGADIKEVLHHPSLTETDLLFCDQEFVEQLSIHSYLHSAKLPALVALLEKEETADPSSTGKIAATIHTPLNREMLVETIKKAISDKQPAPKLARKKDTYIFINSEYKIIKVRFEDILFCEGMKDYTQIYLNGKPQPLITLQNLKTFSSKLPEDNFVRVHRSYVVSLNHIDTISRNEIAIGKKVIPVGHSYREEFFNIIDFHS